MLYTFHLQVPIRCLSLPSSLSHCPSIVFFLHLPHEKAGWAAAFIFYLQPLWSVVWDYLDSYPCK